MLAQEIISDNIPPLKGSDTGDKAIEWMMEFKLAHLPLVENKKYLGLVSEDDILDFNNTSEKLGTYLRNLYKPYVIHTEHIFEVLRVATNLKSTIIPVVDEELNYLGVITMQSLLYGFAKMSSISDTGGVIVLELSNKADFVMSDIARIVESNDAHVLSIFLNRNPTGDDVSVLIKVDVTDIRRIVATFERYEYTVRAYFDETDMGDIYKDRFDSLMNYLNI
ncbi:MAG: CBS domain-containing protein [Chitinophagales bacterium]